MKKIILDTDKLRVDYHFHANLPKSPKKTEKHIKKYWEKLSEAGVDVVISSEHVYKNPKRAYHCLNKFKPKNTYVIPGMEYLTKEGVDIIIFSKDESVYDYEELKPYNLTIDEVVDFVKSKENLYSFVTHPYLKSKTGIVHNLGYERFQEVLEKLNALEVISGNGMKQKLFKVYLEYFHNTEKVGFKQKIITPDEEYFIEREDYYPKKVDFIAVGSDAHQFGEVGNCLILDYKGGDVFERVINSRDGVVFVRPRQHDFISLLKAPWIIFSEMKIKKKFQK